MKRVTCILAASLLFALMILSFAGCSYEMTADDLRVKELVIRERFGGVSDAEQVEYIETINNGYKDYSYYDLEAKKSGNYIVEIRESDGNETVCRITPYKSGGMRKTLNEMKDFRLSIDGYKNDAVEAGDMTYGELLELENRDELNEEE